jgi:LacI family transcriptional regulator
VPPQRKAARRRNAGSTITDVAREAGVAIMTVSRVVNGGSYVSPATEKRVRAAIRRLGYTPNEAARMLKGQRARMIGLVVPDLADSFFATCANAVQQVAGTHGYMTLIVTSERSVETESNEIAMMAARRIAGLLIVPSRVGADKRLRELQQADIPLVTLDRTLDGVDAGQVIVENAGGAEEAVRHLIAHGHRRVVCIGYDAKVYTIHQRILGYRRAMKDAGLKPEMWTNLTTVPATEALLRRLMSESDRPTALFTLNNVTTIRALQAVRAMQLRLPADLAMIGFDDLELAPLLDTPLTAVRQPALEMGRDAARMLFDMISHSRDVMTDTSKLERRIVLPTELILRASCGCNHHST